MPFKTYYKSCISYEVTANRIVTRTFLTGNHNSSYIQFKIEVLKKSLIECIYNLTPRGYSDIK